MTTGGRHGAAKQRSQVEALLRALLLWAALATAAPAWAVQISVVGLFANKAVVSVDGGPPHTVAAGQKLSDSVRLLEVGHGSATFEVDGKRKIIPIGQTQYSSPGGSSASSVALSADDHGHYFADGQINGQAIRLLVDTGATLVALSAADAHRLGLNYLAGQPVRMSTANGITRGWRVRLDEVRVGGVSVNGVDAVVLENEATPALLGMSFLGRMEIRQEGALMTLVKRY